MGKCHNIIFLLFLDYKFVDEILKDPNFNARFITEKSEKTIGQIQMMICPEQRYLTNYNMIYINFMKVYHNLHLNY